MRLRGKELPVQGIVLTHLIAKNPYKVGAGRVEWWKEKRMGLPFHFLLLPTTPLCHFLPSQLRGLGVKVCVFPQEKKEEEEDFEVTIATNINRFI